MEDDLHCFSIENVLKQSESAQLTHGFYALQFYVASGRLSAERTETLATYYYYPSAGTLRDAERNIVFYNPQLDIYHKLRFGFGKKKAK